MSISQPISDSAPELVLLAVAVEKLRTEWTVGWLSSHLVPQDVWAHWWCVILHLILILQLNSGIKTKTRSAKGCLPSVFWTQSRWCSTEEATVVLIGVVVPAAPWPWVLTADPPGQSHLPQQLEQVLPSQSELPFCSGFMMKGPKHSCNTNYVKKWLVL